MSNAFRVHAPAVTTNLGPGFDALGLALEMDLTVSCEPDYPPGFQISLTGEGQHVLPTSERNWILKTARRFAGSAVDGAKWLIHSDIPVAKGLGSSAAATACGVAAGLILRDGSLPPRHVIFEEVCRDENHPDGAGAAVFGGFRVGSRSTSGDWQTVPAVVGADFRVLLVIPERPVPTSHGRSVVPSRFARGPVVRDLQNCASLVASLQRGDWDGVRRACRDELHEPYRLPLIDGLSDALEELRAEPEIAGAYLSGAGPTLAAFLPDDRTTTDVAKNALDRLEARGNSANARIVQPDTRGLRWDP